MCKPHCQSATGGAGCPRVAHARMCVHTHMCGQSPWPVTNGVWQGKSKECNCATKEPEAVFLASTGWEWNRMGTRWCPPSTTAPDTPRCSGTSDSLFAQVMQKEDGLDYWRVERLQKNKGTEHRNSSSCWPGCTWEVFNFENLLVSYSWEVHTRYQRTLKSHFAFFAHQQTAREKLSPATARKAAKRIFILSSQNKADFAPDQLPENLQPALPSGLWGAAQGL